MQITVDQIMNWGPCSDYSRERVKELWNGREALTPIEVLDLEISEADRIWVVLRPDVLGLHFRPFLGDMLERLPQSFEVTRVVTLLRSPDTTEADFLEAQAAARAAAAAARAARAAAWAAARAAAWAAEHKWQITRLRELLC